MNTQFIIISTIINNNTQDPTFKSSYVLMLCSTEDWTKYFSFNLIRNRQQQQCKKRQPDKLNSIFFFFLVCPLQLSQVSKFILFSDKQLRWSNLILLKNSALISLLYKYIFCIYKKRNIFLVLSKEEEKQSKKIISKENLGNEAYPPLYGS